MNRVADQVQPPLQIVDKFVQAARDHVLGLRVRQLGPQLAQPLLGRIAEAARVRAGNRVQRFVGPRQAVQHGPRKLAVEHQEIHHVHRRNPAVPLAIHFQRAGRPQQGQPLDVVERRADVGQLGQQDEVLHVENARRLVGPLEHAAQLAEVPGLAVRHRGVGDAQELLAGNVHPLEKRVRIVEHFVERAAVADHQVELVDVLPHLGGNDLAHAAGVLAGRPQAGQNRIRILGVERQELDDAFLGRRADALLELLRRRR